jgi:tyrosine-protein kinase Etk/Wzc
MNDLEQKTFEGRPERRKREPLSFLDLLTVIAKRRRLILVFTVVIALASAAFLFITKAIPADSSWNIFPDKYEPKARVLVSEPAQGGALSSLLGSSNLGAISGLLKAGGTGVTPTRADLAQALVKSGNEISDAVAREFDFGTKYRLTTHVRTLAREKFKKYLKIRQDKASGLMEIGYQDIDAEFATKVVNRTVDLLESRFKQLTLDTVARKKAYLEQSITSMTRESQAANSALVGFQSKYGVLDLPSQATENIKQIANLQAQIYAKQVDLALQQKYLPEMDARIVRLRNEITQLQQLLQELKEGGKDFATGNVSVRQLPELSVQYLTLKRDAEIRQTILVMLQQQYEASKLEEMDTSQTIQIVERAEVPEVKALPSRSKLLVLLIVLGFVAAVCVAFTQEYFDKAGRDPAGAAKLQIIRDMFPRRARKGGKPPA